VSFVSAKSEARHKSRMAKRYAPLLAAMCELSARYPR
jgi:hypothetical protein